MSNETTAKPTAASLYQQLRTDLAAMQWPRENGIMEGTLIRKGSRTGYFDLGRFGTGVVYGVEYLNARNIIRDMAIGDKTPVKILRLDGHEGLLELSLTEAGRQRLWQQVQDLSESGEIIKVKPVAVNPGGLIANIGDLKAFLPISQLAAEHYPKSAETDKTQATEELQKLIGEELSVKVISVNPKKNKLIISERETVSVNMKELLGAYEVGQVIDGLVSGIADFGVFIRFAENPQIEGLVHISEIDHRLIDSPKETVTMNEAVKVKIIDIKEGRVFLSLKALKSDPWDKVRDHYKEGQAVKGKVYKFNPFGAVINLDHGIQGVIHVSEFGGIEEMKKFLVPAEEYGFVIDAIKPEEKRMVLKVKN
jgi:small subunit ribosomal protein S1